jgi:carboxymethylenebutenolidase
MPAMATLLETSSYSSAHPHCSDSLTARYRSGVQTHTITLDTADGPMACYDARPDGEASAAVIVIQEAFGVNDHIEDVTRRAASAGYHAVAPHLFHRAGGGTAPYDDFRKVMPLFAGLDDPALLVDLDATIAHLSAAGWVADKVGVVGFCMGGRVAFLAAVSRELGAAVSFYGGGIVTARFPQFPPLIDEAAGLQTPWLGLFGDLDESIPVDDVKRIEAEVARAGVDTDVVRYADAGHGFHCSSRPDHFNASAAADGWQRTLAWFGKHLA